MKIVIDIPEDSYKATCDGYMLPLDVENVVNAIKNGTQLPKGHGRLIDADNFIKEVEKLPKEPNGYSKVYDEARIIMMIESAPTIIEVDKAESEDKSCDNCKWNKTEKCQPSTCAMIGCDGHGLWEMIESEDKYV